MPDDLYRSVDRCRSCGSSRLSTVLDLGTPFISDFLLPGESGDRAPLVMARCESCTLVQTRHTVARDRLFREYWYRSSGNEAMVAALRDVVEDACAHVRLKPEDNVIDIGANDGTLLRQYPDWLTKFAVEPAENLSIGCHGLAATTWPFFWPLDLPDGVPGPPMCKVITSVAMFYAQEDPHAFVAAIKRILHPEGVWVVQLQDLAHVLRDRAFDYFCHEHLCLYSLHSFERLIHEHGLEIQDWSTNDVNGGSLRIIVGHGSKLTTSVRREDEPEAWADFGNAIENLKADTMSLLERLKSMGSLVLGYGASTKGNTLLQYYGLTPDLLPAIAERQEQKVGRRTVGSDIPIISETEARAMKPVAFLCLPWHFRAAFVSREEDFLRHGGQLIFPLPTLETEVCAPTALLGRCGKSSCVRHRIAEPTQIA